MKEIDIAIAVSLNIMHYYAKLKNNLEDKLKYLQKIKSERNIAQDQIEELLKVSKCKDYYELKKFVEKCRQNF